MQLEPRLVVPGLQRSVMAKDLVNDGQHVIRTRAVVRSRVSAITARRADRPVTLRVVIAVVNGKHKYSWPSAHERNTSRVMRETFSLALNNVNIYSSKPFSVLKWHARFVTGSSTK